MSVQIKGRVAIKSDQGDDKLVSVPSRNPIRGADNSDQMMTISEEVGLC
jgi:hypothetical protein